MNRTKTLIFTVASIMTICDYAVAQIETIHDVAPIGMNDSENAQLYGKIKTVKETVYTVDFSRHTVEKGDFINSLVTSYNSEGYIETEVTLDSDGEEAGKTITQYNEPQVKRVSTKYNELGNRIEQTLYSYTAEKLCAQMRLTDALAITMATSEVSHGDRWSSITTTYVGAFGEDISKSRFEYNESGRVVKSVIESGGNTTTKQVKLDPYGHPKILVTSAKGQADQKSTYKYVLDGKNNWTERTEYVNNKPIEIRYRAIEYFD